MNRMRRKAAWIVLVLCTLGLAGLLVFSPFRGPDELLNVSYDATREFFQEADASYSQDHSGVTVRTSHAGSRQQAGNIIQGLKADVVTLATAADIDAIHAKTGLVDADWRNRFPHNSSPFTSTIVFLVRSGNPKKITDWDDLMRPDVQIVAPSPRISGAGRWAFLAAWAYALRQNPGDELQATRFVTSMYAKNPVLDEGARGALLSFLNGKLGDVLLTWENEARHALGEHGEKEVAVIYPSMSIKAEPVVAVMDRTAADRGTTEMARAYLQYLFSPLGQEAAARHHLRPQDPEVAAKYADRFPKIDLLEIDQIFGGWKMAEEKHFSEGGTFDRIYEFERLKRHSN
jgi:sulfate/thiosulfate-binding protein